MQAKSGGETKGLQVIIYHFTRLPTRHVSPSIRGQKTIERIVGFKASLPHHRRHKVRQRVYLRHPCKVAPRASLDRRINHGFRLERTNLPNKTRRFTCMMLRRIHPLDKYLDIHPHTTYMTHPNDLRFTADDAGLDTPKNIESWATCSTDFGNTYCQHLH